MFQSGPKMKLNKSNRKQSSKILRLKLNGTLPLCKIAHHNNKQPITSIRPSYHPFKARATEMSFT